MDTPNETPKEPNAELGFSTRTDKGGQIGTQGDANPTDNPVTVTNPNAAPETPSTTASEPATTQTDSKPGESLGNNAPKLESLQHQTCPNCTVGVLYVTRYDPEALHEAGQGGALLKGHESGGAYDVECRNCGFTDSRAFNPGKQWGR